MRKSLLLTVLLGFLSFNLHASFPVHRDAVDKLQTETEHQVDTNENSQVEKISETPAQEALTPMDSGDKELLILILLLVFLWPVAAHRWYAKKPVGWNILFILTFGGMGIWALVDLINILQENF